MRRPIRRAGQRHGAVRQGATVTTVHHPDRLTRPRCAAVSRARSRTRAARDWLNRQIRRWISQRETSRGAVPPPDSIGVLTSAMPNEENYLMNKLARQVIGTNNLDHCAWPRHASTVVNLAATFGSGAMSNRGRRCWFAQAADHRLECLTAPGFELCGARCGARTGSRGCRSPPDRYHGHAVLHLRQKPGTDIA